MSQIVLTWPDLALAAALVLLNALVSLSLGLGLGGKLLLAALRAILQLTLLGFVLSWVFEQDSPWIVVTLMLFMGTIAGIEAVRRTTYHVRGNYALSSAVMLASSMTITLYGLIAVVGNSPWYAPQYAIPILGMLLGNTLNGISLGLETALAGFANERDRLEMLLAHGATRAEASRAVVRRAVRTGMIPSLNMMVVAGVVSIPGMMTGQILAGGSPAQAARYQIFILFLIAAGVALGTTGIVYGSIRLVFDERDRLRVDRLVKRDG